jgi:hypothetical protein
VHTDRTQRTDKLAERSSRHLLPLRRTKVRRNYVTCTAGSALSVLNEDNTCGNVTPKLTPKQTGTTFDAHAGYGSSPQRWRNPQPLHFLILIWATTCLVGEIGTNFKKTRDVTICNLLRDSRGVVTSSTGQWWSVIRILSTENLKRRHPGPNLKLPGDKHPLSYIKM